MESHSKPTLCSEHKEAQACSPQRVGHPHYCWLWYLTADSSMPMFPCSNCSSKNESVSTTDDSGGTVTAIRDSSSISSVPHPKLSSFSRISSSMSMFFSMTRIVVLRDFRINCEKCSSPPTLFADISSPRLMSRTKNGILSTRYVPLFVGMHHKNSESAGGYPSSSGVSLKCIFFRLEFFILNWPHCRGCIPDTATGRCLIWFFHL
jgi:hypothetical protein